MQQHTKNISKKYIQVEKQPKKNERDFIEQGNMVVAASCTFTVYWTSKKKKKRGGTELNVRVDEYKCKPHFSEFISQIQITLKKCINVDLKPGT